MPDSPRKQTKTTGDQPSRLPAIALIDVGDKGPLAVVEREPEKVEALVKGAQRRYGRLALRLGDRATWRWLARNRNPYLDELGAVAARISTPGAILLNLSYEWSCTCGIGPDPSGVGTRMLRTLDWPSDGLGRNLVVVAYEGPAGLYYNVAWPGFVGVLTALAPGRFCAAINQPPMRRFSPSCWFDWAINRTGVWHKSGLPPAHLLRRMFDTCATYAEAKEMLMSAPLCVPAFFSLSGIDEADGCVIERSEHQAGVIEAPTAAANHWTKLPLTGHDRGRDSAGRRMLMQQLRDQAGDDFAWLIPPILNPTTRVAVVANAARETLMVQGWEADGCATQPFSLAERLLDGTA